MISLDVNEFSVEALSFGLVVSALVWATTYRKIPGLRADLARLLITAVFTSGLAGVIGESPVVIVFWWLLVHGDAFDMRLAMFCITVSWLVYATWFFSVRELMRKLCV